MKPRLLSAQPKIVFILAAAIFCSASGPATRASAGQIEQPVSPTMPPSQPPTSQVSSTNQTGGLTAGSIGTVNMEIMRANRARYLTALQEIYAKGAAIQNRAMVFAQTDDAVAEEIKEVIKWENESYAWIQGNMTQAAASSFAVIDGISMTFNIPGSIKPETRTNYNYIRGIMPILLKNIEYLMEHDTMDPQNVSSSQPAKNEPKTSH